MDQVKAALAWLKQHHFWVLSVIIIGATLGVWYSASSSVASQTKSAISKINGEFQSVSGLINKPFKPNDSINERQQAETKKLAEDVFREWQGLYTVQKEKVLIWPPELGARFINAVKDAKFGDSISSGRREDYLNYIKETFPSLVEIVDAELFPEDGAGGGAASRGGGEFGGRGGDFGGEYGGGSAVGADGEPLESHLVQWLDQGDLRSRLVPETVPSSIQIWTLQEDLWVYRTLLQAIANTNTETGATRRERAAVQTIIEMKVGQAAGRKDQATLVPPDASEAAGMASSGFGGEFGGGRGEFGGEFGGGYGGEFGGGEFGGGYGGRGEFGGGEFGGGEFGAGGEGGGDAASAMLAGRYLNDAGEPIMEVSSDYSFGREFKRLPVRMVLQMDTKWLAALMWELANAPLQVEVEQVRFNPEGEAGQGSRPMTASGEVAAFDRRPTHGTVVLSGIVYIFNPPDPSIIATDSADDF